MKEENWTELLEAHIPPDAQQAVKDSFYWYVRPEVKIRLGYWYDKAAVRAAVGAIPVVVHTINKRGPGCTVSLLDWLLMLGFESDDIDHDIVDDGSPLQVLAHLRSANSLMSIALSEKEKIHLDKYLREARKNAVHRYSVVIHRREMAGESWFATLEASEFIRAAEKYAREAT